jgi:hypothetical protein
VNKAKKKQKLKTGDKEINAKIKNKYVKKGRDKWADNRSR